MWKSQPIGSARNSGTQVPTKVLSISRFTPPCPGNAWLTQTSGDSQQRAAAVSSRTRSRVQPDLGISRGVFLVGSFFLCGLANAAGLLALKLLELPLNLSDFAFLVRSRRPNAR